ncbi:hypothetical protein EVAR_74618_1 [Eumeta japonica]|uniref:Uncharacterized protein n=1 Tax=Eumeta variegata TaxID=151549 RepID=A0A4C1WAN5_EUMVA|nr:hypothetical protein EVAR_74618_1 [Eumeta japonica]
MTYAPRPRRRGYITISDRGAAGGGSGGRGGAGGHWQAARPPPPRFKVYSYTHGRRAAAAELRARRTDARSRNILVPHSGPALSICLKRYTTPFATYYVVAFALGVALGVYSSSRVAHARFSTGAGYSAINRYRMCVSAGTAGRGRPRQLTTLPLVFCHTA